MIPSSRLGSENPQLLLLEGTLQARRAKSPAKWNLDPARVSEAFDGGGCLLLVDAMQWMRNRVYIITLAARRRAGFRCLSI